MPLRTRSWHLANGTDDLARRPSEAAASDREVAAEHDCHETERAQAAGIDDAVLTRLLGAMEPDDRVSIRQMCARDLEATRRDARAALEAWDSPALARHLHVMTSLAQTVGAGALAEAAGSMQARMRTGATEGYDETAARMDELARRAARYLASGAA